MLALVYGLWPASTYAEDGLGEGTPKELSGWGTAGDLLTVIVVLIVIIGLIILLIKFLSKNSKWFSSGKGIHLMAGVQLGQHKSMQMVEVGNRIYLLGIGDNVQLIDKIEDPDQVDQIRQAFFEAGAAGNDGIARLRALFKKPSRQAQSTDLDASPSFQEIFYQKMNKVGDSKKQQLDEWLKPDDRTEDR